MDTPEEVPESRLRDDLVRRKDTHTVDFGSGLGLRGQMAPDNLVFLKAHLYMDKVSIIQPGSTRSTLFHVALVSYHQLNSSTASHQLKEQHSR